MTLRNELLALGKKLWVDALNRKMKLIELKKYEIDFRGKPRPTGLFVDSGHSELH